MLKTVSVAVQRTEKFGVLNHTEQETFGNATWDGIVDIHRFPSGGECERLMFESRYVLPREIPLVQCRIVSYQHGGDWPYATDH